MVCNPPTSLGFSRWKLGPSHSRLLRVSGSQRFLPIMYFSHVFVYTSHLPVQARGTEQPVNGINGISRWRCDSCCTCLMFFSLSTISNSSSAFNQTWCFVFEGEMLGHSLPLSLLFIFTWILSYYYSFQYSFAYLARLIQSAASNLDEQWTCPDAVWFVWMLNLSQQVCVMIRGQSRHHAALTARERASARSGRVRAS